MCGRQSWCQNTVSLAYASKIIVADFFVVSNHCFGSFFVPPFMRWVARDQVGTAWCRAVHEGFAAPTEMEIRAQGYSAGVTSSEVLCATRQIDL